MITLIHGPAELLRAEALARIRARIAEDPGLAELNTTVLDGRQVTMPDVEFACGVLPFLAERRLIVVERLLARLSAPARGKAKAEASASSGSDEADERAAAPPLANTFLEMLAAIPPTAELVLVEEEVVSGGPVLRRLVELQRAGQANIVVCEKPRRGDLPGWIRERAGTRDVHLDGAALADLADFVGDDLRQIDQELLKLRDYAGARLVTQADVRRLVPATRAANVFDMVDALASGHAAQAGRMLRHALDVDGEEPLGLLSLLGRRYRQLIQAKALQAHGMKTNEISRQIGIADWQARRLAEQAQRQTPEHLQDSLEAILAADESIKTGRCTDREAMDVLLARLAGVGESNVKRHSS